MSPSIDVIMPVRNGMPFIDQALASVWAQEYTAIGVTVVDDGSTDVTRDYVRGLQGRPIRLLEFENLGPAAARNKALASTTSDLVAFLDADDLWFPGALRKLVEALAERPEAGFAQGLILNFRESPGGGRQFINAPYRFLNLGANLFRRQVFERVGHLDEELRLVEDLDFLMRCWERDIRKAEVSSVVLHYRRHATSLTHGLSGAGFGTLKAYKKQIDRIRRGAFDPDAPRHVSMQRYLGTGPLNQDGHSHLQPR